MENFCMHLIGLIKQVEVARQNFIESCAALNYEQSNFKTSPGEWSIAQNVEHIVWAERSGTNGIWKAIEGARNNNPVWTGEAVHHGLSIEQIVQRTWKPKEKAPEIAQPRWGGPIEYWISSLNGCQNTLNDLVKALDGFNPEKIFYPHPISGPLNVFQRMEFLHFHLERHQAQIESIKRNPDFPKH
jgi:hypothetical protein